ncbi:hypothetical protein [Halocalculus aciditolerans]|nr:hypothetical protein [Halocalculus aciditolerans]
MSGIDMLVHLVLEWFPFVSLASSKFAGRLDWLPRELTTKIVIGMALVVLLWRGSKAAKSTYDRFTDS